MYAVDSTSTDAAGSLTSIPDTVINGVLTVYPENTRWQVVGPVTCIRPVIHNPPTVGDTCDQFNIINVSDISGPTLSSTAQTTVTEALNGVVVECIGGSLSTSPQVGNITISVIAGSPSTPIIDVPIWYTVDTATSGTAVVISKSVLRIAGIVLNGSIIRDSGSEQEPPAMVNIAGNVITVSGLDYDQLYVVTITTACPGVTGSSTTVPITLNTAVLSLTQPIPSIICSDPSLPIQLEWNIDQRVQRSTDLMVTPLTPPMIGLPVVSYTSTGGGMGSSDSPSPYILSETVRNDTYTFNVSVTNAAGIVFREAISILDVAFEVDESTVATSNCLTFNIRPECSEDVNTGDFSVRLEHGFNCRTTSALTTTNTVMTSQSTCLSVGSGSVSDFCYRTTLLYRGTAIETKTNMEDFRECSIADLTVGSGVAYTLSSTEVNSEVPHLTVATLECNSGALTGASRMTCIDGVWRDDKVTSCSTLSFEAAIALAFSLTFLLTLVLGISIGVVSVLVYNKCKRGTDQSSSQPTELTSMSEPVYEEPVDFKPDPHTAGNVAYGHVQPL